MSVETSLPSARLAGLEGELISVRIPVPIRALEQLLDLLSGLSFPVNPQIHHSPAADLVEFPAYQGRLGEIRSVLARLGLDAGMNVGSVLES